MALSPMATGAPGGARWSVPGEGESHYGWVLHRHKGGQLAFMEVRLAPCLAPTILVSGKETDLLIEVARALK